MTVGCKPTNQTLPGGLPRAARPSLTDDPMISVYRSSETRSVSFEPGITCHCQTLPGLPRPAGRFAEGKTPQSAEAFWSQRETRYHRDKALGANAPDAESTERQVLRLASITTPDTRLLSGFFESYLAQRCYYCYWPCCREASWRAAHVITLNVRQIYASLEDYLLQ